MKNNFSVFLPVPLCSHLIVGLVLLLFVLPGLTTPAGAAESKIMPLAEKALLLDGQVIGDSMVVVGERGHILLSQDHGLSWQQQPVPTRATLTSVFFVDAANGWAAGHDSVIVQTRDGGRHWQKIYDNPEDERPILDLWFRDLQHGYAVGAYGLFLVTEDGGKSWTPLDFNPATVVAEDAAAADTWDEHPEEEFFGIDFHLNQITATPNGRVFIAAEAGNLYRSDDACRSWLSLPSPYEGSFYGSVPLGSARLLAFGLRGHLFRSEDLGSSWQAISSGTQATLNDGIRLHDGRIVLAGLAGTLLISGDEGRSFKLYAQESRAGIAKVLQADDSSLILIGEHGVARLPIPAPEEGAAP